MSTHGSEKPFSCHYLKQCHAATFSRPASSLFTFIFELVNLTPDLERTGKCGFHNHSNKFFLSFFLYFLGLHLEHIEVPRKGSNQSYSCRPTPQEQVGGLSFQPSSCWTGVGGHTVDSWEPKQGSRSGGTQETSWSQRVTFPAGPGGLSENSQFSSKAMK